MPNLTLLIYERRIEKLKQKYQRENQRKDAEIARLRGALEPFAEMNQIIERTKNVPSGLEMIWGPLQEADAILKGTDDA